MDLMILHKKLASLFLFSLFIKKAIFVVHIGQLYKNRQVLYLGKIKWEVCMSFFISLNIKTRQAYLGTRILLLNIYLHHAEKTFTFMARFLPVVSKCLAALTSWISAVLFWDEGALLCFLTWRRGYNRVAEPESVVLVTRNVFRIKWNSFVNKQ